MNVLHRQSADLIGLSRKGAMQVSSVPAAHAEHDDVRAAWLGVPSLLILDGGTAFRSQKGLQVASHLAATADS